MIYQKTPLEGAWIIAPDPRRDTRGYFARTFCTEEFSARGLESTVAQCNMSFSHVAGTLRGIHFQLEPCAEVKLVRVQQGSVWDVIVDLRRASPTYSSWFGVELTSANLLSLYVPKGFGHGFVTLSNDTVVSYHVSAPYTPQLERGIRWDDADVAISWPIQPVVMSDKDRTLPTLREIQA
ncbi:dTDP-4-dehydrorhamnose 3,5-epimerase [Steroidobacter sp. S1-65]|uniref:dTDP-4-dehydrorhamnose 3,5-epimerase n=1 Tax=Steroidobacter gossypii TaxID=2805490 RepID=A0ABS1X6Q7_9GAMM|nr:dTDP-4-dehydrorhamnose 3,5-epimerase [Steroidobacter gossypii]